jgi:hypothetical protein
VTVRVNVERIHPETPERAAAAAVSSSFELLAPRRELVVIAVDWGNAPGIAVAPWTLAGVREAARDHDLRTRELRIAACGGDAEHVQASDDDGPRVSVELPGSHRARRVPKAWFGAHLCLAVPCIHVRKRVRGQAHPVWLGPAHQALRALDRACDGPSGRESPNVGARLATAVFASTSIVIDATWWAPMQPDDAAAPSLLALDRCLALAAVSPSSAWRRHVLDALDPWLAANLRLGPMPAGDGSVRAAGTAASTPWPRAPNKIGAPPRSIATEAVAALWDAGRRRPRRAVPERRLGPSVPGDLARLWHAFDPQLASRGAR